MTVYSIEQEVFSTKDKYLVYDTDREQILEIIGERSTGGFDRFFGNFFSIGYKLYAKNLEGELQFVLNKKRGFIWKNYDVSIANNINVSICEEKNWFKFRLTVNSEYGTYIINGDMFAKYFTINKDGNVVAKVKRNSLSFGDTYEVCVYEEDRYKLFIAITIVIDNCNHN